jgi:hypothetical protein
MKTYWAAFEKGKMVHYWSFHNGNVYPLVYVNKKAFESCEDIRKVKIVEVKEKK